jgi:hypothetical protein
MEWQNEKEKCEKNGQQGRRLVQLRGSLICGLRTNSGTHTRVWSLRFRV